MISSKPPVVSVSAAAVPVESMAAVSAARAEGHSSAAAKVKASRRSMDALIMNPPQFFRQSRFSALEPRRHQELTTHQLKFSLLVCPRVNALKAHDSIFCLI
jgi:hypothetical protein